jgi:hypothetical protein
MEATNIAGPLRAYITSNHSAAEVHPLYISHTIYNTKQSKKTTNQ